MIIHNNEICFSLTQEKKYHNDGHQIVEPLDNRFMFSKGAGNIGNRKIEIHYNNNRHVILDIHTTHKHNWLTAKELLLLQDDYHLWTERCYLIYFAFFFF